MVVLVEGCGGKDGGLNLGCSENSGGGANLGDGDQ